MRISDWSSDVCSSDSAAWRAGAVPAGIAGADPRTDGDRSGRGSDPAPRGIVDRARFLQVRDRRCGAAQSRSRFGLCPARPRSEEHTSELQALMRISYAVFCLKKKQTLSTQNSTRYTHITHKTTC